MTLLAVSKSGASFSARCDFFAALADIQSRSPTAASASRPDDPPKLTMALRPLAA